jgi:chemotaxis protein methyltransferase CheR
MEPTASELAILRAYIRRICGLALSCEKDYLVRQRLESLVRTTGAGTWSDLVARLTQHDTPRFRERVIDEMTTHETAFFRDKHPFEALQQHLLPAWWTRQPVTGPVRLWCVGCSTGQEAYSLAMAGLEAHDRAPPNLPTPPIQVLASEVSDRALQCAQVGVYPERELLRGIGPARRTRFFRPQGTGWAIREVVRQVVQFRKLNLLHPLPDLGTFHVIFCRNVLIYFDDAIRQRVLTSLAQRLVPGGVLCLGAAENLVGMTVPLESVYLGDTTVYRKAF